jgi:hypothetical protein
MPVTVMSISLWRKEAESKTGLLAQTLEPLAKAGADLGVVMGYRPPGNEAKAAIEIYPIFGKKVTAAATETGLAASTIPTLLIEGDNKPVWRTRSPHHGDGDQDALRRPGLIVLYSKCSGLHRPERP